jgi:galactokinase
MIAVLDSEGFDPVIVDLSSLEMQQEEAGTTAALMRGIAARMAASGCHIRGFRANTSTQVLKGSGLSSSAAIEILIGTILNDLYHDGSYSPEFRC